jgi:ribosomal protein L13E
MSSMSTPSGLVSAADVARSLGVSIADVRRLARTGSLPSYRRGRFGRGFDLAEVMSAAKLEPIPSATPEEGS